jgi:hypothetical protein
VIRLGPIPYELDNIRPDVDLANSSDLTSALTAKLGTPVWMIPLKFSWIAPIGGITLETMGSTLIFFGSTTHDHL